jgi:nitrate reductase delta subunit
MTTNRTLLFDALARLLAYPQAEYRHHIDSCFDMLVRSEWLPQEARAEALACFERFKTSTDQLSPEEWEEFYTRTFDINPVSSLEVGWHLFGETYERGAFLVQMRDLLRRTGVEESTELPDHITHVLLALGRLEEKELSDFVTMRLEKGLDKIDEAFAVHDNPYSDLLCVVRCVTCGAVPSMKEHSE